MSRAALCAACLALAACKSKPSPPPSSPPPPPAAPDAAVAAGPDAAAVDPTALDEDTLRAGKRTGLGAPDERPEVATEDFVAALLGGTQPWPRVVDRKFGVVELRALDADRKPITPTMARLCGADLDAGLARLAKAAAATLADTGLGYRLTCDNSGLTPGDGIPAATCSIEADGDGGQAFDLVFVPDATLGLRLVGVTLLDAVPPPPETADAYDVELGRADARCP